MKDSKLSLEPPLEQPDFGSWAIGHLLFETDERAEK